MKNRSQFRTRETAISIRLQRVLLTFVVAVILAMMPNTVLAQSPDQDCESQDLQQAKQILDEGIAIFKDNPDATWDKLRPKLSALLQEGPVPHLNRREAEDFRQYIEERRTEIEPTLNRLQESINQIRGLPGQTIPPVDDPDQLLSGGGCPATYCLLFFKINCHTNEIIGPCLGIWECLRPLVKACGPPDNGPPCEGDGDCATVDVGFGETVEYKCATWVFKRNECVQACDGDYDCPSGQECKKPFGTSFKRCK